MTKPGQDVTHGYDAVFCSVYYTTSRIQDFNRTETRSRPSVLIAHARSLETIELVTAPTFDLISARIFSRTTRI
jgi:hypothetical protein